MPIEPNLQLPYGSFAITGFGRSGTMWLARTLDTTSDWTVKHEPSGDVDPQMAHNRFLEKKPECNYGEVNSLLMPSLMMLPVDRRALLIRHPMDILQSCHNCGHIINQSFCQYLSACLALISVYNTHFNVPIFRLEDISTNKGWLNQLAGAVGVHRDVDAVSLPKTNTSTYRNVKISGIVKQFENSCQWFIDRYYS